MSYRVLIGDVLERLAELSNESVQCVVTSPPYWGLRDYGVAGQIGLEPTPAEFLSKMVAVFREVRRVLRRDGTCWVNMGDSYAASPGQRKATDTAGSKQASNTGSVGAPSRSIAGLKPKDLCGMPWRLAFALQEDGWWLRQDIIWSKPNPMPESVTDRCTKAHEYLFLLTKSSSYYYDADAIREAQATSTLERFAVGNAPRRLDGPKAISDGFVRRQSTGSEGIRGGRNKRSVWSIPTEAFPEAHFATFPTKLVEPCILAGTSAAGCCSVCGEPWYQMSERISEMVESAKGSTFDGGKTGARDGGDRTQSGPRFKKALRGWAPSCNHGAPPTRCVVLDTFNGSGTTGVVALQHGCEYIGIELNPEYAAMSERRLAAVYAQPNIFHAQDNQDGTIYGTVEDPYVV